MGRGLVKCWQKPRLSSEISSTFPCIYFLLPQLRGGVDPGQAANTGLTQRNRQPLTLAFTPTACLESPVNLMCALLGCGRKLEHEEAVQTRIKPRTSLL